MLAIQYYRRKHGLSQQTLADLVSTCQPVISNIERGRRKPTDILLDRIANVLGVSPAFSLLRPVVVDESVAFEQSAERVPR